MPHPLFSWNNCWPIISAVGLFCCDKFKETPNEKVIDMSKLTKPYFKQAIDLSLNPSCPSFSKHSLMKGGSTHFRNGILPVKNHKQKINMGNQKQNYFSSTSQFNKN